MQRSLLEVRGMQQSRLWDTRRLGSDGSVQLTAGVPEASVDSSGPSAWSKITAASSLKSMPSRSDSTAGIA